MQPITPKSMTKMSKEWAEFIRFHEVGFFVWPPNSGPERRIIQFLKDKKLQKDVGIKKKNLLFFLDLEEEFDMTVLQLYSHLLTAVSIELEKRGIEMKESSPLVILQKLEEKGYQLTFFIVGIDNFLLKKNLEIVRELFRIYEHHRKLSLLLFTGVYVGLPDIRQALLSKVTSPNNIFFKPLYSNEDSSQFIKFMLDYWKIKIDDKQRKWIRENCFGRFGLIKNALRAIRINSHIQPKDLENDLVLKERALGILNGMPSVVMKTLGKVHAGISFLNEQEREIANYLENIRMIKRDGIRHRILPLFLEKVYLHSSKQETTSISLIFSDQEKRIYDYLAQANGRLISRDEIADIMWGKEADELYSNWAIDQVIHRIREKIHSYRLPFDLKTKKGIGFILLHK